ncbi:hypothetical protein BC834DRAFT_345126 [Gloeopeniophorella convolvens]|nr:hypothetical protein BC834DRAFT_345126 [Gloeopeniophorella convolvens]
MAPSRPLSISRPFPLQAKRPAQVSISRISATGTIEEPAESKVTSTRRSLKHKASKPDAMPTPTRAVPLAPSKAASRKRTRQDTPDENNDGGDAGGRLSRVRQRLISTSSVETMRPHKSVKDPRRKEERSTTHTRSPSRPGSPAKDLTGPRPLSEVNRDPGDTPQRRLRRVGTIDFPTMHSPEDGSCHPRPQPSRIPLPTRRVPSPAERASAAADSSKSMPRAPRSSKTYSSYAIATAPAPAPRASLYRFDLKVAPTKQHTDLWDLPDSSMHAWPGLLVLTDNEASPGDFPPIYSVDLDCATYAYEGRFSSETNALPVFSTRFQGACLPKKELTESQKELNPELGIVMQDEWSDAQVRENQWYVKFWVPIPVSLFRKKDTRMFRLRATISVVDNRMWKKVTVYSGTVVADISHLHKHKDMDGAAARA